MMNVLSCCYLISLSTSTYKKYNKIQFSCAVYWLIRDIDFMNYKSEYYLSHVNPKKREVNRVYNKFLLVSLPLPVNKNVKRTKYNNDMIDEIIFFHNFSIRN